MNRCRHIIAAIICAVAILSIFVSSAYIVHEAAHHHECAGEDCPICQFIAQFEQLRRGFAMALLALLLACLVLAAGRQRRTRASAEAVPALCTLVGRKIRLNN
ncbi:MAG: hypothetical protein Q4C10_15610 [Clostridia bacterium]|nr:hypothetical protein [Clostridia bacterium]